MFVFSFYRASYASAVIGVVILSLRRLSVCLSVCHTRALWLIQRTDRRYFYTSRTGQSFWFSDANDLSEIQTGSPPTTAPEKGGVG